MSSIYKVEFEGKEIAVMGRIGDTVACLTPFEPDSFFAQKVDMSKLQKIDLAQMGYSITEKAKKAILKYDYAFFHKTK